MRVDCAIAYEQILKGGDGMGQKDDVLTDDLRQVKRKLLQ